MGKRKFQQDFKKRMVLFDTEKHWIWEEGAEQWNMARQLKTSKIKYWGTVG